VRNGGDDSNDGRSHATAWASISKVNAFSFSAGDSVLFLEGGTWKGKRLYVDWSGTSTAHAVVGAYHLDNGTPKRGFKTARPVIDGEDLIPTRYEAMVFVAGSRVRVENLAVLNSEGRGVVFAEGLAGQAAGLYVSNTYDCGIVFIEVDDALIEDNHVLESDREKLEDGKDWCSAIAVVRSDRALIRRNLVERSYGEGINSNYGSRDTVIEDNRVFGVRAVGIYADSSPNTTIRRNIVLGTTNSKYWRYTKTTGPGIVLNGEPYSHVAGGGSLADSVQSTNVRIYDNLVAFTGAGVAIWGGLPNSSFSNTSIYNNTFVDNGTQFLTVGEAMPNSVFANNILLSLSEGTADVSGSSSGLTTRNNYYSKGDPGGIYSHSSNRYTGLQIAKMSGWRTLDAHDDVAPADFAPMQVSTTNGAGYVGHLATATATDAYHLDFHSAPHNAPIDLGAIRFGAANPKTPKGPSGLGLLLDP
jgi:parallel beta-helix repeat protein